MRDPAYITVPTPADLLRSLQQRGPDEEEDDDDPSTDWEFDREDEE